MGRKRVKATTKGVDMNGLSYEDESISYIYSYHTIFHIKKDITKAVHEIKRVLKPKGICFINFLPVNHCIYGQGEKIKEALI